MGKRELVDRVVSASGIKKRAAKPVVEAMLKELGDALSRGETLNLQPFGKGIVKQLKDLDNAEVVELRLRRSKLAVQAAETQATDPLAEAAE
ncbi:HU family DNA-binding protein [Psychromarinibacter sp. C21-152]|uniref:HU family DNA-binding protein n=1 Tax=Psychromarinibacter sediminicola TaxID=3033385 RepID=A0AAE3NQB4_9RHOB|nr:HU family DNA-binding protein [Psychromarinibacter sediminicola]MDF0600076.1 HU family DNA-binding protein [Psychromarinibacter sediminicola]